MPFKIIHGLPLYFAFDGVRFVFAGVCPLVFLDFENFQEVRKFAVVDPYFSFVIAIKMIFVFPFASERKEHETFVFGVIGPFVPNVDLLLYSFHNVPTLNDG